MSTVAIQPTHPDSLDDEIVALTLQLDEIKYREDTKKAKYSSSNVPDLEVAYASYLTEIEAHLTFLKDIKLAHSFASAVDTDAEAIAEISQSEVHAQEDRRIAVQMSSDDPELEAPPPYTEVARSDFIEDEIVRRLAALLSSTDDLYEDPHDEPGPSVKYAQRQAKAFETLASERVQCTACTDEFRWADVTELVCGHQYCAPCMKRIIMRGVIDHDLVLIPPRCCGTNVPFSTIDSSLTEKEMEDFQNAELEKSTREKTYCSNSGCGRFIAPSHIIAGNATCPRCHSETCAMCKNPSHEDDCPADPELQATLQLGTEHQWQRCFSCRALVEIDTGCNHMTCKCGAEFCYICGTEWSGRQCSNRCDFWLEGNLERRAEEVVDRAAPANILPAERQRRIFQVQEDLRETDECNHHGRKKFGMIYGPETQWGYRGRFRCEMCGTRHRKFILRCHCCQLDVCMDCRRHRV